jgi:hypothetical protein
MPKEFRNIKIGKVPISDPNYLSVKELSSNFLAVPQMCPHW